ncbi:restriction endonuclease subunit S [Prevotellamassilia timonensis]|uniref:restriction endonuclease subunit S n=1 Tax=Prevotellamassilia timonensis TaxID=1852370 RepID=UPI00307A0027
MKEPKIRFKRFSGEWKSFNFEEVFSPLKNNSLSRADLSESGDIANIHYGDVLIKYGECVDTSVDDLTYIVDHDTAQRLFRNCALQKGDIIFADAAEDNTVGKCSELICKDNERIVSGLHTIACRPKIEIAERYFGYYLNSPAFHNQLLPHIQGTKISSISRRAINTTSVLYPDDKGEQISLPSFFTSLDAQISASTSRLASLKQVKAASLQAMFPQEGETVPKVRFKGFEREWKTRSLNNYAKKRTEKNVNRIYNVTLTNSAEFGIIDQRQFFDHDISNSENIDGYFVVRDKDFVYNPRISASAPVGPINQNKLGYPGVMSPLYLVFEVKGINHDFLEIYFHTALWHKYMFDNGNSGVRFDRLTISDDDFMRMPIPDISLAEQQSIASFFTSLDRQIALHTQRLEKLKQIKAACLDKMFV